MKHLTIMGLLACAAALAPSDDYAAAHAEADAAVDDATTASTNIEHAETVNVGTDAPEPAETEDAASDEDGDDDSFDGLIDDED